MANWRSIVSLQQLPIKVLTKIVKKVGKASSADYCNLRATCKIMKEASNSPVVLHSLCLSPLVKRPLCALHHSEILEKCVYHDNYVAYFVRGILSYFEEEDEDNGMAYLELAAIGEGGDLILEAAYLYGILLILHGNPLSRFEELALKNWREDEEDLVARIRKKLRKTLNGITVQKKQVYVQSMENRIPHRSCHVLDMEVDCPNDAVIRSKQKQALTDSITDSTTTSSIARRLREVKATMSSDPIQGIGLVIQPIINPTKTYDPGGIITHGEEIMEPRRSNKAYELILAQVETKVKTSSSTHHHHATKKSHLQKMTQEEDTEKELTICSITSSSGSSIGTSSADLPYMEAFTFGRSIQHQTFTYQNYSVLSSFPSSLDVPSCTRPHKILHNFKKSYLPFLEKKEIKHQRLLSKNASCELFVNQVVPRILTYPLKPSRYK